TDRPPKPVLAHCLVDESYGLAEREVVAGRASAWFLLGAGISLFSAWNLSVWTGLILDRFIDVPTDIGLDFIFPLSFVALTVPLVRSRPQLVAAVVAAAIAIGAGQIFSSGVTIFLATLGAIGTGFLLEPAHGH
ncbi:MAG TPA: hypothetical protein PK819_14415, partial [Thermomicrobiales bacterium]|nr:hypothetical protein [Thermomicrobiales bacterium]